MGNDKSFESLLYTVNDTNFEDIALKLFQFQAGENPVYKNYLSELNILPTDVRTLDQIPFLPISFFKTQSIKTGNWKEQTYFLSSTTTGSTPSRHWVVDSGFYLKHTQRCFEFFFGPVSDYHFFALLPSYLEREHSSLVAMMDYFIKSSQSAYSGFYMYNREKMLLDIQQARANQQRKKIIVWGVSFALLDLADQLHPDLSDCFIFETGGMKGRRKELTRTELHDYLKEAFGVQSIHSEYGMTELFSQAYSTGNQTFTCSPWMRIHAREVGDPFAILPPEKSGGINVIDLANYNTIAFIETEDAGLLHHDGTFEVQGRLDNSDIRGCNLMVD